MVSDKVKRKIKVSETMTAVPAETVIRPNQSRSDIDALKTTDAGDKWSKADHIENNVDVSETVSGKTAALDTSATAAPQTDVNLNDMTSHNAIDVSQGFEQHHHTEILHNEHNSIEHSQAENMDVSNVACKTASLLDEIGTDCIRSKRAQSASLPIRRAAVQEAPPISEVKNILDEIDRRGGMSPVDILDLVDEWQQDITSQRQGYGPRVAINKAKPKPLISAEPEASSLSKRLTNQELTSCASEQKIANHNHTNTNEAKTLRNKNYMFNENVHGLSDKCITSDNVSFSGSFLDHISTVEKATIGDTSSRQQAAANLANTSHLTFSQALACVDSFSASSASFHHSGSSHDENKCTKECSMSHTDKNKLDSYAVSPSSSVPLPLVSATEIAQTADEDEEQVLAADFDLGFDLDDGDDCVPPSPPTLSQTVSQAPKLSLTTDGSKNISPGLIGGLGVKFSQSVAEEKPSHSLSNHFTVNNTHSREMHAGFDLEFDDEHDSLELSPNLLEPPKQRRNDIFPDANPSKLSPSSCSAIDNANAASSTPIARVAPQFHAAHPIIRNAQISPMPSQHVVKKFSMGDTKSYEMSRVDLNRNACDGKAAKLVAKETHTTGIRPLTSEVQGSKHKIGLVAEAQSASTETCLKDMETMDINAHDFDGDMSSGDDESIAVVRRKCKALVTSPETPIAVHAAKIDAEADDSVFKTPVRHIAKSKKRLQVL